MILNDSDPGMFEALGLLYFMTQNYDLAINATRRAIDIKGPEPDLLNRIGSLYLNSGHSAEAIHFYTLTLEQKPFLTRARVNLAKAYGNNLDYRSAAECYLQAL